MKQKLSLLIVAITFSWAAFSQGLNGINYQAVARNLNGTVLSNKVIQVRFTITLGNTTLVQYQETQNALTNAYGLFNLVIGKGVPVTGTFNAVSWITASQWLQVEVSVDGGAFISLGKNPFNAVPYALMAAAALPTGAAGGDLSGNYPNPVLSTSGVTAGAYGNATNYPTFTVDAKGRVTAASQLALPTSLPPSGPAGGDLSGTYPNPAILIPLIKSSAQVSSPLIGVTNTNTTGVAGAIQGASASTDASATAIQGTISATAPGGFSTGVRGINNGTGGLGIGVWGSQNGSGWGVYGTAVSGIGVNGSGGTGIGVNGTATSGTAVNGTSNTGVAGNFVIANAANANSALTASTAGDGSAVNATTSSTTANVSAIRGVVSATSPGGFSAGVRGENNGTGGLGIGVWGSQNGSGWGVYGTAVGGIGVNASSTSGIGVNGSSGTGTGGRFTTTSGLALFSTGAIRLSGIGEAAGRVLTTDASGNATWQPVSAASGTVAGSGTLNYVSKWTPSGSAIGNSQLYDDGLNVGINTATPSYKLHILHGGSTGILNKSTASFSVLDIDAFTGDAAIRFINNGVSKWNLRNQPGTDNLQFFQLGGGGERLRIDNATGNIAIGGGTGGYKLDILHGGSTGILNKSSASYSVLDIDAFTGDAAIRFINNGVSKWNLRNQPGTDNLQFFQLGGGGERMRIDNATGNIAIGGGTGGYKLDILHGGSTGILNKSSASYSVLDIDAFTGDAAIRFINNGVSKWNLRNQPGTDNLQIFQLGGGGERMRIDNATGNIAIGGGTGGYKLDILHGGSTGILNKSSASYSVLDIDAFTGDAAIRFINNGVSKWNLRNQPGTDNLQIFQLGGGGERMRIDNATGNVVLGGGTGGYKLDILHGGSTGILNKSSAGYSVLDIDAFTGDAAIRFMNNGVGQWNVRNQPGTDNFQIFELGSGERMRIDNTTGKVWVNGDFTALGVKAFTMDHPLDPENKLLMHAAVESNEVLNAYSGNAVTDANGKATVHLPDYFESINKDFRYQLTVIGSFAQAIISKEVNNNQFEIATNQPNIKVSWEVKGVRNDAHMKQNPFTAEQEKTAAQKGKYIDPAAYNQPASKGVTYDAAAVTTLKPAVIAAAKIPDASASSGGSLEPMPKAKTITTPAEPKESSLNEKPAVKNVKAPAEPKESSIAPTIKTETKKAAVTVTGKQSTD